MWLGRAEFASKCPGCGSTIHPGDPIAKDVDEPATHASCAEGDTELDEREPCPGCWLTICDCEREGLR